MQIGIMQIDVIFILNQVLHFVTVRTVVIAQSRRLIGWVKRSQTFGSLSLIRWLQKISGNCGLVWKLWFISALHHFFFCPFPGGLAAAEQMYYC